MSEQHRKTTCYTTLYQDNWTIKKEEWMRNSEMARREFASNYVTNFFVSLINDLEKSTWTKLYSYPRVIMAVLILRKTTTLNSGFHVVGKLFIEQNK